MKSSAEIVQMDINVLEPAEYNPRRLTKKQFADIKTSLEEFGFVDPAIVNKNPERKNKIVGGHQRIKVAKAIGYKVVPVVFVNLSFDRERELNIRLNKNSGEWDFEILANEFDIPELTAWGFTPEELGATFDTSPEDAGDDEGDTLDLSIVIDCRDLNQRNQLVNEFTQRGLTIISK